ncbi:CapA family protein [Hyphococcus sp. DH-69]|uniref:CapA family protein n=1 Tax=Hyphococcus formosus TaxID=3143534 RepID=UPI00398A8153
MQINLTQFAGALTSSFILFFSTIAHAQSGDLRGRVTDENGKAISATVEFNGNQYKTDAAGAFSIDVADAETVTLSVKAPGHYAMVQSFSSSEIATGSALNGHGELPGIQLVTKKPNRVMLAFGGDTMMGRRYSKPFRGEPKLIDSDRIETDTKKLIEVISPYLKVADFTSINLETSVFSEPPNDAAKKLVTFYSPPETLDALRWAGVDYVALGNNHTYDYLDSGLKKTLEHIRKSDLGYSGAGLNEKQALKPYKTDLAGRRYAFMSYVGWEGGNPTQSATDTKGGAALGTTANILSDVRKSASAGALPIVQYHGGLEYADRPTMDMETKLKLALDEGAAVAIGHHPHVFQGLELYNNRLIAWSLGNFLFDQYFYSPQATALLYVWLDDGEFYRAEVVPLYIKGYKPTPATDQMRRMINKRIMSLSSNKNIEITPSGGHLFAKAQSETGCPVQPLKTVLTGDARLHSLDGVPWFNDLAAVETGTACAVPPKVRLGKDLLARGDFDAYDLFKSKDRSWLDQDKRIILSSDDDYAGDKKLVVTLGADESAKMGMRKFLRVYKSGSTMTLAANISSDVPVRVTAKLQRRKSSQGLSDALSNGPTIELGSVLISPESEEALEFDFASPRVGTRSIRVLLEFESVAQEAARVEIDDLTLVEWKTPFSSLDVIAEQDVAEASHIQTLSHSACDLTVISHHTDK